jgi:hypothetical protein
MSVRRRPHARCRNLLGGATRLLVLMFVVVGFGLAASRSPAVPETGPAEGDVADAERAIEALLDPDRSAEALTLLPSDFTVVTGVRVGTQPALDGTVRAVHVGGGCSAPWGDDSTRWDFGTPCRSHDLGYDLLRYAEKKGSPLEPDLREALDERLSEDMYATCDINPQESRSPVPRCRRDLHGRTRGELLAPTLGATRRRARVATAGGCGGHRGPPVAPTP